MKRVIVLAALLLPAMASAGELGNPAVPIEANRWSLGVEYFYDNGNFRPHDSAHFNTARSYMDEAYAKAAYGAFVGNEIFLKLGAADMHSNAAFVDASDFDQGYALTAGAGVKQSFEVSPRVRVGGLVQGAVFSDHERTKPYPGFNETLRVKDPWEVDLAFAASYVGNGWVPYAGPVLTWHAYVITANASGTANFSRSTNYAQAQVAGGFIGLGLWKGPVKGNVEVRFSSQVSAGMAFNYLFR